MIYAIIASGGKQYRVSPGQLIEVESLVAENGSSVALDQVLLVADGDSILIGKPTLEGAKVTATVVSQLKHRKVTAFKYKSKVRYRRKRGHRQSYTSLAINEIVTS